MESPGFFNSLLLVFHHGGAQWEGLRLRSQA